MHIIYICYICNMNIPTQDYVKPRLESSLNDSVKHVISLISYKNGKPQILGSSALASQLFSSDFDLFERVYESGIMNKATRDIYNVFRNMMRLIKRNPGIYFMDFKCGIDEDLYLPEEKFQNAAEVRAFYKDKQREGLLTDEQFETIVELSRNAEDYYDWYDFCRRLWTIRWTPESIERGFVNLPGNRTKSFIDCLDDKTVIKIDVVSYLDGQFVEFSNIFELHVGSRVINLETSNIVQTIKRDVSRYAIKKNWYKVLKRIFSIAKIERDLNTVKILTELFNSNTGLANRVRATITTIIDLIDKGYRPIAEIHNALQYNKQLLGNVFEFDVPPRIFEMFDEATRTTDADKIYSIAEKIEADIMTLVNNEALQYIKKHKIPIHRYVARDIQPTKIY